MAKQNSVIHDLIEQNIGDFFVLDFAEPGPRGATRYLCKCVCGVVKSVARSALLRKNADVTRSCGCSRKRRPIRQKHGQARDPTRTYRIWEGMLTRCTNPRARAFPLYGGRGIMVCKAWKKFENFYADMGDCPLGMTIERINNNGNYEPKNCRWASRKEQANNTRRNRFITFNDVTHTLTEWSNITGINLGTLHHRLKKWTLEKALAVTPGGNPTI